MSDLGLFEDDDIYGLGLGGLGLAADATTFAAYLETMLKQVEQIKSNVKSVQDRRQQMITSAQAAKLSHPDLRKPAYVDACPPGYATCEGEECPDEAEYGSVPPMYTADGSLCFFEEGVREARKKQLQTLVQRARTQSKDPRLNDTRQMEVSVQLLRDFVRLAGELTRTLNNIGKLETVDCGTVNTYYTGTDEASNKGRQAFCETLIDKDNARRCQIQDNHCVPFRAPAAV